MAISGLKNWFSRRVQNAVGTRAIVNTIEQHVDHRTHELAKGLNDELDRKLAATVQDILSRVGRNDSAGLDSAISLIESKMQAHSKDLLRRIDARMRASVAGGAADAADLASAAEPSDEVSKPLEGNGMLAEVQDGKVMRLSDYNGAQSFIPFFAGPFRTILWGYRPALVVPIDHHDVVPAEKDRTPYHRFDEFLTQSLPTFKQRLEQLSAYFDPPSIPEHKVDEFTPYWQNAYFGRTDANVLYSMVRHLKPKRIIEIGSGNSTRFARQAITDGRLDTKITCIDPAPREEISKVADEIIRKSVIHMPEDYFDILEPGDFLFNDGSHFLLHGTDLPFQFLRIMPRLKSGVFCHFHDIHAPLEYPPHCDTQFMGESYLVAIYAMESRNWDTYFPVKYMYSKGLMTEGVSYWFVRR